MNMPFILAIEPDPRQAAIVNALAGSTIAGELLLVDSIDAALEALEHRVPDLLLTSLLLSPKDDAALTMRLRALDTGPGDVQTLVIPVLATGTRDAGVERTGGLLSRLLKGRPGAGPVDGCDPQVFAAQVNEYLARAESERREREVTRDHSPEQRPARASAPMLQDLIPVSPVPAPASEAIAWDAALPAPQEHMARVEIEPEGVAPEIVVEAVEPVEMPVMPAADVTGEPSVESALHAIADSHMDTEPEIGWPAAQVDVEAAEEEEGWHTAATDVVSDLEVFDEVVAEPVMQPAEQAPVQALGSEERAADDQPAETGSPTELAPDPVPSAVDESGLAWNDLEPFIEDLELAERLAAVPSLPHSDEDEPEVVAVPPADELWMALGTSEQRVMAPIEGPAVRSAAMPPPADEPTAEAPVPTRVKTRKPARTAAAGERPAARRRPARPRRLPAAAPKPMQDEWGLYDPEQCGFAALLDRLESITQAEADERKGRDRSAIMRR